MTPEGKCEYPQCPPEGIITDLKTDIGSLCKDVKEILSAVNDQRVVNAGLNNLIEEVKELKGNNKSDHDEVFGRLRILEINSVTKKDIVGIITIIGILFAVVSFVVNIGARAIK